MNPRGAQNTPAVFVDLADAPEQTVVVDLAHARLACAPVVVSAQQYPQATTHQAYRKLIATTLDRLILQDDPLARNVAASQKIPLPGHACQLGRQACNFFITCSVGTSTAGWCHDRSRR